ncbi:MAG: TusE/DsrC/DsvC family sulfur relay protein, partial [Planctomycetota bacterium]
QWDEMFAEGMARQLGIPGGLTEAHWEFIRYLRHKFLEEKTVPLVVHACMENKLRLNKFMALFPTGYFRGACKIAGLNFDFMADTNLWVTYENIPPVPSATPPPGEVHAPPLPEERKPEQEVSPLGYLDDFNQWNEAFADWVAEEWNLPGGLTERHWEIIRFLREYYEANWNIPTIIRTCRSQNLDLEEFGKLFPQGYRRGACRAAGLPFFG